MASNARTSFLSEANEKKEEKKDKDLKIFVFRAALRSLEKNRGAYRSS